MWTKADMLVPGETVNVYGGSDGESQLLISSPQRGRAFLGTVESRSARRAAVAPADRPTDAASTDTSNATTPTDTPPTSATWPLLDKAEKSPPEPDTEEETPTWEPPPWGVPAAEARLAEWAKWADSTTFSYTGLAPGYDKEEVDAFRRAVRDTFRRVRKPPVRSDDLRGQQFSTHRPGYYKTQVDAFLEKASTRLAAMESTDAMTVTVVYESLFGNTRKVAEAISDGVREAFPYAHVECVAVGKASEELIRSTNLLIVGGPTHLWRMTTDSSRKRHISRAKKAQAKGEPPHELEPEAEGPGLRDWFYQLPPAKRCHTAAFDTRRGSVRRPGGACHGIARKLEGHDYELVRNSGIRQYHSGWQTPNAFNWMANLGRFIQARSSGRRSGELSWCGRARPPRRLGDLGPRSRATSSPTRGGNGGRR